VTVSAPIIGLIATLGGAIVGAIAAIYGPSLLHKRQAEEKTQENKALKNDAAIIRLVALRVAGKAWLNALRRVADDLSAGRIMNLDAFDAEMNPLGEELDRSTYGLMVDNTWVSSAEPVFFPNRKPQLLGDETTGTAYTAVLTYLHAANTSLRRDLRDADSKEKEPGGISKETLKALDDAERARAHLNTQLLAQIEKIAGRPAEVL
jgi:hypothetical protein